MSASSNALASLGVITWRLIVPAWVTTGAIFKLISGSPTTLPESLLDLGQDLGLGLHAWLATLVSLEFLAVAIMLMIRPLARLMAAFMLASFCAILTIEMVVYGNVENCGCLGGDITIRPWVMIMIDGALLLAVLLLGRKPLGLLSRLPADQRKPMFAGVSNFTVGAAVAITVFGTTVSFARLLPMSRDVTIVEDEDPTDPAIDPDADVDPDSDSDATSPRSPRQLPAVLRVRSSDPASWVGLHWSDIEVMRYVPTPQTDLDSGKVHIIFYRRSCNHCEVMFNYDLTGPMPNPVVAVELPEDRTRLRNPNQTWAMPETQAEYLQLPVGPDWIVTAPLIITLQDGQVICSEMGEHEFCYFES